MRKKLYIMLAAVIALPMLLSSCKSKTEGNNELTQSDIVLAYAGQTQFSVLLPENPDKFEQYACEELVSFFEKATGATLKVASNATDGGYYISLGRTPLFSAANGESALANVGRDGFVIKKLGNSLVLCGGGSTGTVYAVYEFLEKNLGVKFFTIDETKIPVSFSVNLLNFNHTVKPAINDRAGGFYYPDIDKNYAMRMRTFSNYGFDLFGSNVWANWAHTYFSLLPPSEYEENHKNWYWKWSATGTNLVNAQLCLSQKDMWVEMVERVKELILARPDTRYVMVGQMDYKTFCGCNECKENTKTIGNSGFMMQFINYIAEKIEIWLEDKPQISEKIICTFAYQATETAPVDAGKPLDSSVIARDNVLVMIAPIDADWKSDLMNKDYNAGAKAMLEGWSIISKRLALWTYGSNFDVTLQYFDDINSIKQNINTFEKMGVEYLFQESRRSVKQACAFDTMRYYILAKLMWDSSLDVELLIDEFMDNYYKEAAPDMKRFYYTMRYHVTSEKLRMEKATGKYVGTGIWKSKVIDNSYSRAFWNKPVLEQLLSYIDGAYKAIDGAGYSDSDAERLKARINIESLTPRLLILRFFANEYIGADYSAMAESFIADYDALGLSFYPLDRSTSNSAIFETWRRAHK